jgi:hypothetical protein
MIGALLSPSSRYSQDLVFELYYFVPLHGRTELDAAFGLLAQLVKILDLGPVLETVGKICGRVQEEFEKMVKDPLVRYQCLEYACI